MDSPDEFGSGSTSSISHGTTSGCIDQLTCIGHKVILELWPHIEYLFSTNRSEYRAEVDAESYQTQPGFDICLSSFYLAAVTSCFLLASWFRWLWQKAENRRLQRVEWDVLPADVQRRVIAGLPYENVYQLKAVSKPLRDCVESDCVESDSFESLESVTLSAPYFFRSNGALQCAGYDASLRKWRRLRPFSFLPEPDVELFKEYLVCSHNGIMCVNVSKTSEDRLIIFNPLSGKWRELPPLIHRRSPVLMHLVVDSSGSYQVIVAGASKSGDECLSRETEVFDSRTGKWERTSDMPGPAHALNEYQTGVFKDGYVYCIAFLDQEAGRGILRYNVRKAAWSKNWTYPIPFSSTAAILQLVGSGGEVYLFSEQETANNRVEHCVDRLDHGDLKNLVRRAKVGGKSLESYPEYTCVPFGAHCLCVFNTIDHSGLVYDVRNHGQSDILQAPGFHGEGFYSLNPMSFTIQPSFKSKV